MKNIIYGLVLALVFLAPVKAQTVGTIGVGGITYSASSGSKFRPKENVISAIDSSLNAALLKTRKFTVLDFAQLESRLQEQGLSLEKYYDKSYTGTEYSQAGLDYILTANITEFGLFKKQRGKSEVNIGLVDIDFKLIGVADVTNDFESSVSAQYSSSAAGGDATDDILGRSIQQGVDQLVDQVISKLFPIRVMKISEEGSEITLNYGEGLLKPGDTILVYPLGQDIAANAEGKAQVEPIATLQVIKTSRKFSSAQALQGQNALKRGQKGRLLLSGG